MGVDIALNTPLADALNAVIQPKLVEIGWSSGGLDDSALSEYIILMLVNGKTQDQIAAELSGDLLNLGPDDPGAVDFSSWLFEQVDLLDKQINGQAQPQLAGESANGSHDQLEDGRRPPIDAPTGPRGHSATQDDTDMVDGSEGRSNGQIPTEPRSMRNGTRGKRMLSHMSRAMDRSNEAVLHRVRAQQGTERINGHQREPPRGPRINPPRAPYMANGRPIGGMHPAAGMGGHGPAARMMKMTPEQQMQLFAMYEEQARVMSQILSPQQQQQMFMGPALGSMMAGGYPSGPSPPTPNSGRSLFDRVQPMAEHRNGAPQQHRPSPDSQSLGPNRAGRDTPISTQAPSKPHPDLTSSMEVEPSQDTAVDPATTVCRFNLSCTKEDCAFAHQSPAAPPGMAIDVNDECSFGAACKNRKCVARHPSPAKKSTHQAVQDCKFFPQCTNPACPFRHPTMPVCRNGADCTRPGCQFTHVKIACKYNPCLNPACPYKHAEGQKRGAFDDKVWVADGAKETTHVSERKFVDEEGVEEELIIPTSSAPSSQVGAEVTA